MHRQPYKGCPFECNLAEITQNGTVWRMRTNNVKRVYLMLYSRVLTRILKIGVKLLSTLPYFTIGTFEKVGDKIKKLE